jgi:hypothetical protein
VQRKLLTQTRPCVVSGDIPIPWQNLLSECAWCTYSVLELARKVCAMYLFIVSTRCIMHRVHTIWINI